MAKGDRGIPLNYLRDVDLWLFMVQLLQNAHSPWFLVYLVKPFQGTSSFNSESNLGFKPRPRA